jgi:hypothetical protein
MQRRRVWARIVVPFSLLSVVSVFGQGTPPPQVRVETIYPRHVARGQTTVINVAVPSRDVVQAAEISPATGVTVAAIKGTSSESEQAIGWWEITVNVAKDAPTGDRSLILVMKMGRAAPATISVPTHLPAISDLKVVPPQTNQPTFEVTVTAADTAMDLGETPYVWFMADCGTEPIAGAVRGKVNGAVVRAILPHLRRAAVSGTPPTGKCDLQVRLTDSPGIESNTLKSTIEFTNQPGGSTP